MSLEAVFWGGPGVGLGVVCSVVLSKDIEPFTTDHVRPCDRPDELRCCKMPNFNAIEVSSSLSNYFVFGFLPAAPCSSPLGVGWDFTLPDSAFSASSTLDVGKKDAVSFSKCMFPFAFLSLLFTDCFA